MYKKNTKSSMLLVFILILETIFVKIIVYGLLPNKYRYDSGVILSSMRGNFIVDRSYQFTADFFNVINIFKLNNIYTWSIYLSLVCVAFIAFFIRQNRYNFSQALFIIEIVFFLNIYVFVLSKELIQIGIYILIYLVIMSDWKKQKKYIAIFTIFFLESIIFRPYYILIGSIFLFIAKRKKEKLLKTILVSVILVTLGAAILSSLSMENYNTILNARSGANLSRIMDLDAKTIIINIFPNSNIIFFFINTLISVARILIPVELLFKGVNYIPFIIFQLYFTFQLITFVTNNKRLDDNDTQKISNLVHVVISFIIVAAIFEPDFGSLIKHESALIMFVLPIIESNRLIRKQFKELKHA